MREKIIISKNYIDKVQLIEQIEKLGKDYRIIKEDTYENSDLDLYKDVSDDELYLMSFRTVKEEHFSRDKIIINGDDYFIYLIIEHDTEVQSETNEFIKEILSKYNDLYVTDETYKDFYSLDDINSGNVAAWLKE